MAEAPDAAGKLWNNRGRRWVKAVNAVQTFLTTPLCHSSAWSSKKTISLLRYYKELFTLVSKVQQEVSQFFRCRIQQTSKWPLFSTHNGRDMSHFVYDIYDSNKLRTASSTWDAEIERLVSPLTLLGDQYSGLAWVLEPSSCKQTTIRRQGSDTGVLYCTVILTDRRIKQT